MRPGGKKQAQIIVSRRARLRSRLKASLIALFRPGPARRISPPANVTVLCQADLRRRENGSCLRLALANISSEAAANSRAGGPRIFRPKSRQPDATLIFHRHKRVTFQLPARVGEE